MLSWSATFSVLAAWAAFEREDWLGLWSSLYKKCPISIRGVVRFSFWSDFGNTIHSRPWLPARLTP